MSLIIAFLLGALAWTLTEYILHRGFGHRGGSRNPFTVEHLAHHADVSYFAPTRKKVLAAALIAITAGPVLYLLLATAGIAATLGYLVMYAGYEIVHRQLHVSAGRTRYGRWARRHHLYHHYSRPRLNHGVTTPIWDFVFRTLEVPDIVRVPRRNALPWMLDADGELYDTLTDDFVLVGRGDSRAKRASKPA